MTAAVEAFREWISKTDRSRNGEPHPFTDQERNLMGTAFISGWHQGRTHKKVSTDATLDEARKAIHRGITFGFQTFRKPDGRVGYVAVMHWDDFLDGKKELSWKGEARTYRAALRKAIRKVPR